MTKQRFTRTFLASLAVPPGKESIVVFDADLPSFGVRISKGGSRQFVVQYRPAGERGTKRLTLGRVDLLPLDEARRQAKLALAKVRTNSDPQAEKAKERQQSAVTLGAVADAYIRHSETRKRPGTVYLIRLHLTKHWGPLRSRPLHKITRLHVAERLTELANDSGPVSANRCRSALSAMFAWAITEGLVESNPVAGTRKPHVEKPRERVLNDRELAAVWKACRDDDYGKITRLLILTGLRRNEVAAMRWDEIDLSAAMWTVPAARMKNRREHEVPLPMVALSLIASIPKREGSDFVFGKGKAGFVGFSNAKASLDERLGAGFPKWTPHYFRRSIATGMNEIGVLPHVADEVLSHTGAHKAKVAGVYNLARYRAQKRTALNDWAAHVARITT